MSRKTAFERTTVPDEGIICAIAPPGLDFVTLCGQTDWLGSTPGKATKKPITCAGCLAIIAYCQSHQKPRSTPAKSEDGHG